MQFRSSFCRFRRRTYSQVVSGVLLMLLGMTFLLSPLSARSQEPPPSPTAVPPTDSVIVMATAASAEATTPSNTDEATTEPPAEPPTNVTDVTSLPIDASTLEPTDLVTPALALTSEPTALVTPILTLTPTIEPTALVTPTATLAPTASPLNAAPLTITMSAAADQARPSQQTSLTAIVDSGSITARTARVEIELDPRLEAVSASASNGTCVIDVPVVCTMSVQASAPGVITIVAQVRPDAPVGGKLVSQAVARDDLHEMAASEPVAIEVRGSVVAPQPLAPTTVLPTSTPKPSATMLPTSTPAASPTAVVVMSPVPLSPTSHSAMPPATAGTVAQAVPTALPTGTPKVLPSAIPAASAASQTVPTSAPAATAPASTPSRVPMPDDVFTAPEGEPQQLPTATGASATSTVQATPESPVMQSNNLPSTASQAPLLGWSSMLLGFGLVANGARRIRKESAQVVAASREARQLEPLVDAIIYLNVLAKDEAEQMQQLSGECVDMLKDESATSRKS